MIDRVDELIAQMQREQLRDDVLADAIRLAKSQDGPSTFAALWDALRERWLACIIAPSDDDRAEVEHELDIVRQKLVELDDLLGRG